jgi:hypothetical protein
LAFSSARIGFAAPSVTFLETAAAALKDRVAAPNVAGKLSSDHIDAAYYMQRGRKSSTATSNLV